MSPAHTPVRRIVVVAALALTTLFSPRLLFGRAVDAKAGGAESVKGSSGKLTVLTTAAQAHGMSTFEAARRYPVHIRGVVTCIDPTTDLTHAAIFVHDSTGTIYVMIPDEQKAAFPAGTIVDIQGVTGAGTAAPIVDFAHVQAIGHMPLPIPPLEDLFHLETGAEDGKWVEVEGTIHSFLVRDDPRFNFKFVTLQLAMMGGTIGVSTMWDSDLDYAALIDAKVRIRGNAAPLFNRNDQIVGARIFTSGLATIKVAQAAPSDPFAQPVIAVDDLLRWNQIATTRHRVHVRGQVILRWPGSSLCIRDATRGVCAQTSQNTPLALGDVTDVVGFADAVNGTTVLTDATFNLAEKGLPLPAKRLTAEEALLGKNDSELVQLEGRLIGSEVRSSDTTLLLSSGKTIFTAILPHSLGRPGVTAWKIGSELRVTGVCSVRLDVQANAVGKGTAEAKSFRILMRSAEDVAVLQSPSWWTSGHALIVFSFLAVAIVGAFGWITLLRRRVHSQTAYLKKAHEEAAAINELAHAMQEVTAHRKLTGRVSASGSEQIAQLGIGFNKMLSELEENELATRRAEAKLQHQAVTDELTGLLNRRAFMERLTHSLANVRREERTLGVIFIDLDGFKSVNDRLGHRVGDLLLVEVSKRLQSRIRQSDTLARLGGDEFTVILTSVSGADDAEAVANSLLASLLLPFQLDGDEVAIGASIGISIFPRDGEDAAVLLKHADNAMYAAKRGGKNQARYFTPELGCSESKRVSLESQLPGAIARNEIHLHYQPAFHLDSHRLTRFEALARWTHPVLGAIPPDDFIALAEENGQIVALGAYVLREACMEAVKWQALAGRPIQVAVNVSGLQFARDTFLEEVVQTLCETGLSPRLLQIELTESVLLIGAERVAEKMEGLRALGVGFAIDDFGTGYSCLSYLPILPFDTMKIDRSFVRELGRRPGAKAVVTFLIALAHNLKMQVVVEGVETVEQLDILHSLNGNEVQGYLLGRPMANPQSLLREEDLSHLNTEMMVDMVRA